MSVEGFNPVAEFTKGYTPLKSREIRSYLESLAGQERQVLVPFFGKEMIVPTPPKELLTVMIRAREIGWTQAEPHFLPEFTLSQDFEIPGWKVKPNQWFWTGLKNRHIPKDAATLRGTWVISDGTPKPEISTFQIPPYEDVVLPGLLSQLREDGKISWKEGLPKDSRFNIGNEELRSQVYPAIAILLGLQPEQVRSLREIEYNFLGNLVHPEWSTTTAEWLDDIMLLRPCFGGSYRNISGMSEPAQRSPSDGLKNFKDVEATYNSTLVGFRPIIVFPIAA